MGKYSLMMVMSFGVLFGWISSNINRLSEAANEHVVTQYERKAARMTARSLANMSLAALDSNTSWRGGYADRLLGESRGRSLVHDWGSDTTLPRGRVRIVATGSLGALEDSVRVLASVPAVPLGVHGSITANSDVTELGDLFVDGRDHDLNGNLIPNSGTYGVSTTQNMTQSGSSDVGGTYDGTDYPPSHPADPSVVELFASYDFPETPDEVFGYAEGTLKGIAQAGANGGQYVTDPDSLTFPLSGVTYVELVAGGNWNSIDFGESAGVLIVHNATGDAAIKNLNTGTFRGLIIADDIEKIHALIIGAVISMTETPSGNCIGNGTGDVLFSSEALIDASIDAAGGGSGMRVLSWID